MPGMRITSPSWLSSTPAIILSSVDLPEPLRPRTPIFRYARSRNSGPYLEAAIGLHFLSDTHIKPDVTLSTHFQFGDHIGVGVRRDKYDLGIRLQHLSNAGLRNPNPGVNFLLVRL